METPLQFDFVNLARSQSLETFARDKVRALERFCDRIIGCHIRLEEPHRHQHQGRKFQAHVRLTVPGAELFASSNPQSNGQENPQVAVRDAFIAIRRQLQDQVRIARGDVKTHAAPQPA